MSRSPPQMGMSGIGMKVLWNVRSRYMMLRGLINLRRCFMGILILIVMLLLLMMIVVLLLMMMIVMMMIVMTMIALLKRNGSIRKQQPQKTKQHPTTSTLLTKAMTSSNQPLPFPTTTSTWMPIPKQRTCSTRNNAFIPTTW